jgi:hypothetical protein
LLQLGSLTNAKFYLNLYVPKKSRTTDKHTYSLLVTFIPAIHGRTNTELSELKFYFWSGKSVKLIYRRKLFDVKWLNTTFP